MQKEMYLVIHFLADKLYLIYRFCRRHQRNFFHKNFHITLKQTLKVFFSRFHWCEPFGLYLQLIIYL